MTTETFTPAKQNWLSRLKVVNHFYQLGESFSSQVQPLPLENARLVDINPEVADLLQFSKQDRQDQKMLTELLNGQFLPDSFKPLSMIYAGHQFGSWVPQLGDGRAMTLAQIENNRGQLWELQLKGSGPTPYSRHADGRAVLRSTIREYLCSEAMHSLGIPTTRALGLIDSDTPVYREEVETGAILMRMAPSHIRFGNFELFASRKQNDEVHHLAEFVLEHHRPELLQTDHPHLQLYRDVIRRTAELMAQWQSVGFCHGVMNTDNMSILGLTIDYGPFGFMENYNPGYICNHSDHSGRYAFNKQPDIGWWNLAALGNALLPLLDIDQARQAVEEYKPLYQNALLASYRAKLGLANPAPEDSQLIEDWLNLLQEHKADFTNTFRALSHYSPHAAIPEELHQPFANSQEFRNWIETYKSRLTKESRTDQKRRQNMLQTNPKYILRNYLAENAIARARQGDYSEVVKLREILSRPFDEQPENQIYAESAPAWASGISISCSS